MFPSKNPLQYILMTLGVCAIILLTLYFTHNPLAMLGIMLLPQVPIVARDPLSEPEGEPAIGFHADID